jgi:hypothetical protein
MKKYLLALICLLLALVSLNSTAVAQQTDDTTVTAQQVSDQEIQLLRQNIRSQRKQIVAANMTLTENEATKFWPVYDRYVAEMIKLNDTRYGLIKEYAQQHETMTDAQANSFIKRWISADEAVSQLRLKWIPEFEKVISPKKTAAFFQIDRRTVMMIDLQLASQIPIVKP